MVFDQPRLSDKPRMNVSFRPIANASASTQTNKCVSPAHRCGLESSKALANGKKQSDADRFEERA
jgi:hypothetical protein